MKSSRELIHLGFCGTHGRCRYGALRKEPISRACKEMDRLLDLNDEQLLHAKATSLHKGWTDLNLRAKNVLGPGIMWAIDQVDPYVKVDAFDQDPEEYVHPGVERPDCPACVAGREHYHRKSDGSPVTMTGGA